MTKNSILILSSLLVLYACSNGKEKHRPVYLDEYDRVEDPTDKSQVTEARDEEIVIPYRIEDGVKYVSVTVNGVGFDMVFDTGCSGVLISLAEAQYLYQKGKLTQNDILGVGQARIADGSLMDNMVVNLRDVEIGDKIHYHNVRASVSANIDAPLLLGNDVLDSLAIIKIDNERNALIFTLK